MERLKSEAQMCLLVMLCIQNLALILSDIHYCQIISRQKLTHHFSAVAHDSIKGVNLSY